MKATYDPKTDTLSFELKSGPVAESDEDKPGVILDLIGSGNIGEGDNNYESADISKKVGQ